MTACPRRICECARPSSPDQSLTLPELRPTFGRKLLDRERGSARHCGLNLLAHLSLGRSGTPLRGGGVLFRHAASLSGMSQLTACAISTSQGTRSGSGRGMRPSANTLASSMRFWGKVQGAGRSPALVGQPSPLGSLLREEGTCSCRSSLRRSRLVRHVSIHAPARGATGHQERAAPADQVSIHAPARGATFLYSPCP